MKLRIHSADADDFFGDIVRAHSSRRRADVKSGHCARYRLRIAASTLLRLPEIGVTKKRRKICFCDDINISTLPVEVALF
jgi:hypothetical protein